MGSTLFFKKINWILIVTNSQPKALIYQSIGEKILLIKDTNVSDLEMFTKTLKFITKYQN